jgi:F420-0:gamma-glutamyl ligase-like protein
MRNQNLIEKILFGAIARAQTNDVLTEIADYDKVYKPNGLAGFKPTETIIHSRLSLLAYAGIFQFLCDELSKQSLPQDCIWELGIYPFVKKTTAGNRLSVYFIPTLYDTINKTIYDFRTYYDDFYRIDESIDFVYDLGNVYP